MAPDLTRVPCYAFIDMHRTCHRCMSSAPWAGGGSMKQRLLPSAHSPAVLSTSYTQ